MKITTLMFVALMATTLTTACGGADEPPTPNPTPVETRPPAGYLFALYDSATGNFWCPEGTEGPMTNPSKADNATPLCERVDEPDADEVEDMGTEEADASEVPDPDATVELECPDITEGTLCPPLNCRIHRLDDMDCGYECGANSYMDAESSQGLVRGCGI